MQEAEEILFFFFFFFHILVELHGYVAHSSTCWNIFGYLFLVTFQSCWLYLCMYVFIFLTTLLLQLS